MNFRLFGKEKVGIRVGLTVELAVHGSILASDSEHEAEISIDDFRTARRRN